MYELGYAIASGKDVVLICSIQQSEKFPFDIQHRGIITYSSDSASDFDQLKKNITNRIKAIREKQVATQDIVSVSPLKETHGLKPSEITCLALIMANINFPTDRVSVFTIKRDMEKAGYTPLATQLALIPLSRMLLVDADETTDDNGNYYTGYRVLPEGENWLLENQEKLELRLPKAPTQDIPF
jgi:hypothetical protein